jgi:hypothetical protein
VIIFGLGLSLLVAPLTATALGALDDSLAGIASGVNNAVARAAGLLSVAVLPLAAGIGSGSLTSAADLHPTYHHAMLISAGLMVTGGVLAAVFVPTRLPSHSPASPAAASPAAASPTSDSAAAASSAAAEFEPDQPLQARAVRTPIRAFCDPSAPPVHPRHSI